MSHAIGIVIAPYHAPVRDMLGVVQHMLIEKRYFHVAALIEVPGAWEIPLAVQRLLQNPEIEGVITLGAIERGETGHGQALAHSVYPALQNLSLAAGKPVSLGIIGPGATPEQIAVRAAKTAESAVIGLEAQFTTIS